MFGKVSEPTMHWVRWVVTSAWLLLIFSLFYDPISPILTDPNLAWSPFRLDPDVCVRVQGVCLEERPYRIGAAVFWGMVVPGAIFILVVFGHELWRRICPLSFISQLPNALKWQRQNKKVDPKTGKTRYEIFRVKKDSWLANNHLYFQFGWLFFGLCARILCINSDRAALALWLIFTIGAAIAVGYLYGGKSWCQYFCPMAPVQKIYAEPGGIFTSKAHMDERSITQSMCRTVGEDKKEQSACVACKSPCIDIDSERSYWDNITRSDRKLLYYGYFGLVVGYFLYYYLYAGNWDYYFSGAWAHQEDQLAQLLKPGFYLFNRSIAIPKLIAVPLTLGLCSWLAYKLGEILENTYRNYLKRQHRVLSKEQIRHQTFAICTYVVFNIFFVFAGRPFIRLLPPAIQYFYDALIVLVSTAWLYRNWGRNPSLYSRESLASRFRKQLAKLELNLSQYLEDRTLEDLNTDEIYVLAKVLPSFSKEKRHQAYKGVLREALEEGYADTASSLEVLRQLRSELDISDEEHRTTLTELGVEDPELLDPHRLRNRENLVRLTGYRKSLERLVNLQQRQLNSSNGEGAIANLLADYPESVRSLRQQYSISSQEDEEIFASLDPETGTVRRAEFLLSQLQNLVERYQALNQPILLQQREVLSLLLATVKQQKQLLAIGLLEIIESLGESPEGYRLARSFGQMGSLVLQDLLEEPTWQARLAPKIVACLQQPPPETAPACSLEWKTEAIAHHLEALLLEPNPSLQAISLYELYQLDPVRGREQAQQLLQLTHQIEPLVKETAQIVVSATTKPDLAAFPSLEKLVYMASSDFFKDVKSATAIALANRGEIKTYQAGEVVTEAGDTCRELLLLIAGEARIESPNESKIEQLLPGQILDELEVLSHVEQTGTIVATAASTRILAIPVDALDDLLERDGDFARRVLEMESRRLQQLLHSQGSF
ncbi:MAG: Crp/Fnr family transcriptional regulator [Cyanosarcina radialis HA8281-LM2]|jgi:hypothetical protein|nr:Crp/Fnr family transcriptional regulator [Cyanosarcina radialis HA8281-LM2]